MINILPPRWRGLHPIAGDEPSNTYNLFVFSPMGGLIYAVATSPFREVFKKTGPGSFTKAFAHGTTLVALTMLGASAMNGRALKPYLQKQGCALKPFRLVEYNRQFNWSMVAITGASIGVAIATRRNLRPQVTGWQRYVGFGSYGALSLHPLKRGYSMVTGQDTTLDPEHEARLALEVAAWREAYAEIYESAPDDFTRWWLRHYRDPDRMVRFGIPGDLQITKSGAIDKQLVPSDMYSNFAPDESTQSESDNGTMVMNPPPGSAPHVMVMAPHGGLRPTPMTDYLWQPGEDGEKLIRDWIKTTEQDRHQHSVEAEHVWVKIAEREQRLRTEPSQAGEEKTDLICELDVLRSIHVALHTRIGELDWILADSKKILLRIKGETFLPEPSDNEVRYCDPRESLIVLGLITDLVQMQVLAYKQQKPDEKVRNQLSNILNALERVGLEYEATHADFMKKSDGPSSD